MQEESRNRLSFSFGLSRAFVREAGQRGRSVIIAAVSAESEIKLRIAQRGPITFAEFMELALYWPDGGYYSRGDPIGGEGDFFTSPLAHPAFGALLAVQLFQMWEIMACPSPFTVIEPGAGNGLLCRDVLAFADGFPQDFTQSLRYVCVDRRGRLREEGGHPRADRITADHLPLHRIEGCVLSNEFLDALPVHQVVVEEGRLREVFVALDDGGLVAVTGNPSTPALAERLDAVRVTLAEGQTAEINLDLNAWADDAAACLSQGFVLTVDYGRPAAELYSFEARPRGTLTTFYRHLQTDSPLDRVGQQDITAQVDFTSVVRSGKRAGLDFIGAAPQGMFLQRLGLPSILEGLRAATASQKDYVANRNGMLELVKPGGLGDFQVLLQGKNVGHPDLWGLNDSRESAEIVGRLSVPVLTPAHLNLRQGRWPA